MGVHQTTVTLAARPRGCHLITSEIEQAIGELAPTVTGLAHLFLLHTSASLSINEDASPDVRGDLSAILDSLVPENGRAYRHTMEGSDDMPAHAKSSLVGVSLTLPISEGKLAVGTWQGIYLCEHRNRGGQRSLVITVLS